MNRFRLSAEEIDSIKSLLKSLPSNYGSVEDGEFLRQTSVYAHELPRRVRSLFNDFKLLESPPGYFILSGYPIDDERIGPTPTHWKDKRDGRAMIEEEALLVMYGALLGDLLGWATQQDGRIVHNVMPIKGHENEQLGTGSLQPLWWHNEDAFHPYRGDYLGLFCLRNPDRAATILACVDSIDLDQEQVDLLFEPHFTIRPDESHLEKNKAITREYSKEEEAFLNASYAAINRMNTAPEKLAVLYGGRRSPYVRLDPYFMDRLDDNQKAQAALDELIRQMDANLQDLVLEPGDCLFLDNYKAVHGRRPFQARYDGRDRWLKRINVTRDLRKSRSARFTADSRVLY